MSSSRRCSALTWFHHWLARRRKDFAARPEPSGAGGTFRLMNEVPTLALIVIVTMVVRQTVLTRVAGFDMRAEL